MVPFYLGIDLHLKRTYMVLMNANGEVIDKQRIFNDDISRYLQEQVPQETYAVLEATRNWPLMYDLLNEHVQQVDLLHAKAVRTIANAAVKTDQIDASTLAHLARLNYIPKAYAAPKETRDLRQLLRHREWMVNQRSKAKNRVHAVLAAYNLVSPVTDLFGVAGCQYLEGVMEKEIRPAAQERRCVLLLPVHKSNPASKPQQHLFVDAALMEFKQVAHGTGDAVVRFSKSETLDYSHSASLFVFNLLTRSSTHSSSQEICLRLRSKIALA